ncbi:hypothetical protein DRP05_05725 [Archaeoglobales archaeon]|nr:MAG: hypothetical protein DRP05_05725 [Archaeoglobales archaeon]
MRLWITFPNHWIGKMKDAAKMEGYKDNVNEYIRQLVRGDLKAKGLLGTNEGKNEQVAEQDKVEGVAV